MPPCPVSRSPCPGQWCLCALVVTLPRPKSPRTFNKSYIAAARASADAKGPEWPRRRGRSPRTIAIPRVLSSSPPGSHNYLDIIAVPRGAVR